MPAVEIRKLELFYSTFHALKNVNMSIEPNRITSMIGPSGCGKSTLLRCLNRMNDNIEGVKISGEIIIENINILRNTEGVDIDALRRKVGMVFQRPNPFPLTVFENVAFGLRIHKMAKGSVLAGIVEESLKGVLLWEDLKDKLDLSALSLSLEQKQRLCIARLLSVRPDIILLDEPCSALDPIATTRIEELMIELKKKYTIVIVTHNMQQAARVSDDTGFMLLGDLVEFGKTSQIFTSPKMKQTEDYVTGRFG